jgi:hypothetical protein
LNICQVAEERQQGVKHCAPVSEVFDYVIFDVIVIVRPQLGRSAIVLDELVLEHGSNFYAVKEVDSGSERFRPIVEFSHESLHNPSATPATVALDLCQRSFA